MHLENCVWRNLEYPFVTRFRSWPYYASHVVCLIYNVIQTLLIIFLNYLAIHAFCKSSQLRRKTTLFIVMVLSANDLAIGLVAEPLVLLQLSREILGNENCLNLWLNVFTLSILLPTSMTSFLVLNFEIYLSIIHPIFHKTKITNKRVLYLLLFLWFVQMVRAYLFAFHLTKNTVQIIATLSIALGMLAMVYMHSRIFLTVCKRRKIVAGASSNFRRGKAFLSGVRDAKSCLLVLICTVCCYLPATIENASIGARKTSKGIVFTRWSLTFLLSASVLNSIVFYWRNKILRTEAKNVFRTFCLL